MLNSYGVNLGTLGKCLPTRYCMEYLQVCEFKGQARAQDYHAKCCDEFVFSLVFFKTPSIDEVNFYEKHGCGAKISFDKFFWNHQ